MKTCTMGSKEILGLQRQTLYQQWSFAERTKVGDSTQTTRGEECLHHPHEGHLSYKKVQDNAREHVYWPGIDADIEDYTQRCQECIKRSQIAKEPLQPHDIPEGLWRKLGMDYFNFNGNSYVLVCDYFLKFPFLYRAKTSFWSLRDHLN